jgi:metallo-beta-lactamase family protein
MRITFLGGAGTVTGSKYLVEIANKKILVDCGLFQGRKELRLRNWQPFPLDPKSIDAVILTHAHLDHSGYLPVLIKSGYEGPVYSTSATRDLCAILLTDSGYLMERDAEYANRRGFSKHKPALPLYTEKQARAALDSFRTLDFDSEQTLGDDVSLRLTPSGHILGSAFVSLRAGSEKLLFSGDLGRPNSATMVDPAKVKEAMYLIVESTYGNRLHEKSDPEDVLAEIITSTANRGGTIVVPSFAVGRAQSLLYHLNRLKASKRVPDLPIFLDSPMAINASDIFCDHQQEHRLSEQECRAACGIARFVNKAEDSKKLDESPMPKVLISASGMATGGRILHHLKHFAPDPKNTILFTGFQASGTRGDRIVKGETAVKIFGEMIPVRARVENLNGLSAHADRGEILEWLGGFRSPPKYTFVTHGEPTASAELAKEIKHRLGWTTTVPELGDIISLSGAHLQPQGSIQ